LLRIPSNAHQLCLDPAFICAANHSKGGSFISRAFLYLPSASFSRPTVQILRRIPKASRLLAGRKLSTILEAVVSRNDHTS